MGLEKYYTVRNADVGSLPARVVQIQPFLSAVLREGGAISHSRLVAAVNRIVQQGAADAGGDAAHPRAVFHVHTKGNTRGRVFMDYREIEKLVVEIGRDQLTAMAERRPPATPKPPKSGSRVGALESRMEALEKLLGAIAERVGAKS